MAGPAMTARHSEPRLDFAIVECFVLQSEWGIRTGMPDLEKALADILAIRSQIAAGTAFQGYGPSAVAATALVALATTLSQAFWLDAPTAHPIRFFFGWLAAAVISATLI